jgi:hypothetical protein
MGHGIATFACLFLQLVYPDVAHFTPFPAKDNLKN